MFSAFKAHNLLKASSLLVLGLMGSGPALAAGPNAAVSGVPAVPDMVLNATDQALVKDVAALENRFFFHSYGHDPMEKRLERLELLTHGAAQAGSNAERLTRLKQSVVERDKEAAKTIAREQKGDGELAAKTNYPVLGTLEGRILKKTYPSESIDQRLGRMESQLFGMPAQAMSYVDRIERLKKTIGMDIAAAPSNVAVKPGARNQLGMGGPMPRAGRNFGGLGGGFGSLGGNGLQIQIGPGGQIFGNSMGGNLGLNPGISPTPGAKPGSGKDDGNGNKSGYLYDKDGNVTGWYQNSSQSWSWPPSSNNGNNGNDSGNGSNGNGMNGFAIPQPGAGAGVNVFEAMDQMHKQMMRQLNSPAFGGFGGGMDDSFSVSPPQGLNNQRKILPAPQQKKFTSPNKQLPAYSDPNSI